MTIEEHVIAFLALVLLALALYELRRYWRARRHGAPYPLQRLYRRCWAFMLLEGALLAFLIPRLLEWREPLHNLAALGIGLILALASMAPILRDWRDIRRDLTRDSDELAQLARDELQQALEAELRKTKEDHQA